MTETVEIEFSGKASLDIDTLAQYFWSLSDKEMAEFFAALHKYVSADAQSRPNLYGLGEMQWCYMTDAIKKHSPEARDMFLAFSGFAYDYWPQKAPYQFGESA